MAKKVKRKKVGYAAAMRALESGEGTLEEKLLRTQRTYVVPKELRKKEPSRLQLFRYGKKWQEKKGLKKFGKKQKEMEKRLRRKKG